ncbi:MAG: thioredoxin-disulfide reductase [Candidatus Thermoplasmatota archaeon]|nr:thioredoxin-disulfide reductase [Candidatus Thermoplasmatota archaeon]
MGIELAVVGAGSAGYAAGIYAGRAGIDTVIFDTGMGGGLTVEAPKVENYPGFKSISGIDLMEKMKNHAQEYAKFKFYEEVKEIKKEGNKFKLTTTKGEYEVGAVIICTGTTHKKLGVKGEKELRGHGVSYCATCDGFFFKDKDVAVIGGGSSALIEAIYLNQVGCKVSIIHRRDRLRAEKSLEEEALDKGIKIIWNSVVEEIVGKDRVEGMKIRNVETGEIKIIPVDGVFISIGETPRSDLAKKAGVETDEYGYIKTDGMQRTNIRGVYAAGDVTGGVRQIVTACAQGAKAALTSTKVLGKMYPF